jgi:type IV secretory pathway VirJ component
LSGLDVLCLYGADERDSACPLLPRGVATLEELRGGHHFGGAYRELADRILRVAGD